MAAFIGTSFMERLDFCAPKNHLLLDVDSNVHDLGTAFLIALLSVGGVVLASSLLQQSGLVEVRHLTAATLLLLPLYALAISRRVLHKRPNER